MSKKINELDAISSNTAVDAAVDPTTEIASNSTVHHSY